MRIKGSEKYTGELDAWISQFVLVIVLFGVQHTATFNCHGLNSKGKAKVWVIADWTLNRFQSGKGLFVT